MITIFFATIFIAELVIAGAAVLKIMQLDRCVNLINSTVAENNPKLKAALSECRDFITEIRESVVAVKMLIMRKKQEYVLKTLRTLLFYYGIFFFKGKHKKIALAYQLGKEIYEVLKEGDF